MAESALSLGYPDIAQEVSEYLGYDPTIANLGTDELRHVNGACDSGLRMFLGGVDPRTKRGYRWSFLDATATITTVSGTESYDLPDDYASHRSPVYFPTGTGYRPVEITSKSRITRARAVDDSSGTPVMAAITAVSSDGTSGQRFQISFYPTPDSAWAMSMEYSILTSMRLRTGTPYPLGGMEHAETIKYACLAAAEVKHSGARGDMYATFIDLLIGSIEADKRKYPDRLGYNGDGKRPHYTDVDRTIYLNGVDTATL